MLEARFLFFVDVVVSVDIVVVAYPVIKIAFVPKPQHLMGKMTKHLNLTFFT
jgi:hypothetical protein